MKQQKRKFIRIDCLQAINIKLEDNQTRQNILFIKLRSGSHQKYNEMDDENCLRCGEEKETVDNILTCPS